MIFVRQDFGRYKQNGLRLNDRSPFDSRVGDVIAVSEPD